MKYLWFSEWKIEKNEFQLWKSKMQILLCWMIFFCRKKNGNVSASYGKLVREEMNQLKGGGGKKKEEIMA